MLTSYRAWGAAFAVLLLASPAAAYQEDVALRSLGRPHSQSLGDPATVRYRALTSEILLAMTPTPMESAETVGLSGFAYGFGLRATKIHADASFWTGQAGAPVLEAPLSGGGVPDVLWTPSLRLRKGLPLSSEVGMVGTFLPHSHLIMLSGSFKVALHEDYVRWLPSLAVQFSVHQLIGAKDFSATGGDLAGLLSYPIAIPSGITITPYFSYSQLYTQVSSAVLDETPFYVTNPITDQNGQPGGSLYQFPTLNWSSNTMPRIAGGARLQWANVTFSYEFSSSSYVGASGALQSHGMVFGVAI